MASGTRPTVWLLWIALAFTPGLLASASERPPHWAFQPVAYPTPPSVQHTEWARNPIDYFVLNQLEERGLHPAAAADPATLLRRVSLDLIGLPPTPAELDRFIANPSDQAYQEAVDRLLASPQYGERWARHWLDLARYAESEGFKADETRPNAWRYRDYVIQSLNEDKPYDRFVQEQIAGDELFGNDPQALVATAFNRHYPDESNARNLRQRRQEILNDITDTVGAVFTGLTFACARCHDHKYDPIKQADYYRLQAFFANTTADDHIVLAAPEKKADYARQLAQWEEKTATIRSNMTALEEPARQAILRDYVEKFPEEIQAALNTPMAERTPFQCLMVAKANLYIEPSSHQYIAPKKAIEDRLKGTNKTNWQELNQQLHQFDDLKPATLPIGTGMRDVSDAAPATYRLSRGAYDVPLEVVEPGLLPELAFPTAAIKPMAHSTGRRSALAHLLTDPNNPLTARVIVNRLWHYHFGRGIVATPNDFGEKGARPTHPLLLDWLATELVNQGWSLKKIHRLMVTSNTYRQSTQFDASMAKADPENRLLWRYPRRRLEGETIRDSMLAISGLLNPTMGGPSVFPKLPPGMTVRGGWTVTNDEAERNRRSVYVFVRRNTRYPMFLAFDMPDTHESCARRNVTTSPIQALTLLNSELSLHWARAFAGRVISMVGSEPEAQIEAAYRLAYSRRPDESERKLVREFFERQLELLSQRQAAGEPLALPYPEGKEVEALAGAALVDFCHMLMNANEFVYLN